MEHDDTIDRLLRRADNAAGVPHSAHNLATNVRHRRARRTRHRMAAMSLVACVACGLAVWQTANVTSTHKTIAVHSAEVPVIDVTAIRLEFDRLEQSADARLAMVDAFLNRKPAPPPPVDRPDAVAELRWQREQAALILLRQGDRLSQELDLPEPAAVAYQRASDTFPETQSALIALARLRAFHEN